MECPATSASYGGLELLKAKKQNETNSVVLPAVELLKQHGALAYRNNTGAAWMGDRFVRFGVVGMPDILGYLPNGRGVAIECKMPGRTLTADQERILGILNGYNVATAVITDPHEVIELVSRWNNEHTQPCARCAACNSRPRCRQAGPDV